MSLKGVLNRIIFFAILIVFNSLVSFGQDILEAPSAWQKGNPNSKNIIEVFNDYQCPSCASFNEDLKEIGKAYSDKILIIFRNNPLINIHVHAMSAAKAVEAAGKQEKFWEMMELIYQKQDEWKDKKSTEEIFIEYAEKFDLDIKRFKQDFESREIIERINLDIKRAKSLKIDYTPAVLLNGRVLKLSDAANLKQIISQNN